MRITMALGLVCALAGSAHSAPTAMRIYLAWWPGEDDGNRALMDSYVDCLLRDTNYTTLFARWGGVALSYGGSVDVPSTPATPAHWGICDGDVAYETSLVKLGQGGGAWPISTGSELAVYVFMTPPTRTITNYCFNGCGGATTLCGCGGVVGQNAGGVHSGSGLSWVTTSVATKYCGYSADIIGNVSATLQHELAEGIASALSTLNGIGGNSQIGDCDNTAPTLLACPNSSAKYRVQKFDNGSGCNFATDVTANSCAPDGWGGQSSDCCSADTLPNGYGGLVCAAGGGALVVQHHGDFDGDGRADFLSANRNFDTWLANGDGTFRTTDTAPPGFCSSNAGACVSTARNHVWAGDFDGDGRGDFVSANGNFDAWLGGSDGKFTYKSTVPPAFCGGSAAGCLSTAPSHAFAGDFDGDGRSDLLSANPNFDVWLGNGDGSFRYTACGQPGSTCTAPPNFCKTGAGNCVSTLANHVFVGDINGDGATDFVSANGGFDAWIADGDGTFTYKSTPPPSFCSSAASSCISTLTNHAFAGDFDGDGTTDFLSANVNFDVWLSNGDGSFRYGPCGMPGATCTAPPAFCSGKAADCLSTLANHVVVGDFDGDGRTDFASADGKLDIWLSNGDGTFRYQTSSPPGFCSAKYASCLSTAVNHVLAGDVTGDGRDDLVSANPNFDVFVANTDGTFGYTPCGSQGATCTPPPAACTSAAACVSTRSNAVIVGN